MSNKNIHLGVIVSQGKRLLNMILDVILLTILSGMIIDQFNRVIMNRRHKVSNTI